MDYTKQRKLCKLFPEIKDIIMAEDVSLEDVFEEVNKKEPLRERFLTTKDVPEEWSVEWALSIGDLDLMIEKVTETNWDHVFGPEGIPEIEEDDIIEVEWFN